MDCQKKFRNFWGSTWAIRRMNDKLCLEHGLSIVENPKSSRNHYGTWLGSNRQPGLKSTGNESTFGIVCRRKIDIPGAIR
ncbi:relaxase/mobilization nuclease domain-containing protein [Extibacter muris]|nr:relaxase/mobilization nuclease domain-containing protein [Extibacter muris]MCU0080426.1 relaxase/mobilization nuclease domain-containing protein [Extibacter muris]